MTVVGNHEIERDNNGEVFKAWSARYPTPYRQSGSSSNLYYSFNYGGGTPISSSSLPCACSMVNKGKMGLRQMLLLHYSGRPEHVL